MDWPALAISIVTYNRAAVLRETIRRLRAHLAYAGPVYTIVADDGSTDGTHAMLAECYPDVEVAQSQRAGLGANTNAGLRLAFSKADFVLQLQDDMHLLGTLDLHPHVELLMRDETAGFVRLWGVGGHRYMASLENNHWRIYWHSEELYIPSDRPHLKHFRFHRHYGFYPEGLPTAQTEDAWCHQCKDRAGQNGVRLDVFVPHAVDTERSWEHVGWHARWRDHGL